MFSFFVVIVMNSKRDKKFFVVVVEIVVELIMTTKIKTKRFIKFKIVKTLFTIKLNVKFFRHFFSTKNFVQTQKNVLNAKNEIIENANNVEKFLETKKTKNIDKSIKMKKYSLIEISIIEKMLNKQKRKHIKQNKQKIIFAKFDVEKLFIQIKSKSKKRAKIVVVDVLNNDEKIRQQKKKIKQLKKKFS